MSLAAFNVSSGELLGVQRTLQGAFQACGTGNLVLSENGTVVVFACGLHKNKYVDAAVVLELGDGVDLEPSQN